MILILIQRVGSFFWLVLFPPLPVRGKDKVTTQCEIEILTFFKYFSQFTL